MFIKLSKEEKRLKEIDEAINRTVKRIVFEICRSGKFQAMFDEYIMFECKRLKELVKEKANLLEAMNK